MRRDNIAEEILEIIATKKYPKLVIDTKPKTKKSQRTPRRINIKSTRGIILKFQKSKYKENNLKGGGRDERSREHSIYIGTRIRITQNFSLETMKTRREWIKIFKVLKETD